MIVLKDLTIEARTKDMWVTMMAFVLMVIFLFAFAVGASSVNLRGVFPGLIWMAFLFAGMMSIGRGFQRESYEDTMTGLVLAPGDRLAVFLAKLTTAFLFMFLMELLSSPIFFALFNEPWYGHYGLYGIVLVLGTLGFVGVGTLLSAMGMNLRGGDLLMPVLLMPLEVPVMITAVQATTAILSRPAANPWPWLHGLMAYDAIFLALPMVIYEYLWEV
ncbi:cytochrome c-type biogenesis protein CcmB [Sulfobacillus acidophilus TPY]|uniref:Heme exporter protein B n=1 Tax=Sulfobacillus acidophilus (strain ATCC 700253 / DSM 10332 / NAL) TaxID=679936 RepID=G8TXQ6_SULAD|nr:cytochrome c-type biogenesis protein CcmB [Sulfobacillus acidophilus TPY]AEW05012.1 cytochrome c-type biogenesis protein CcmB [Sulfobacillus acidophilus DSM 10332]